ncbi:MAG TPA: hypothetical protein VK302_01640 [Terriglobales bacterium]|nr:hypothetical protein [Terriglobales bacterium]
MAILRVPPEGCAFIAAANGKRHRRPVLMMHLVQNQSTPFSKLEINDNGIELSVVQ